ncbi:MAG: phosphatase domain-containing protein [Gemmatimonadota bacterium]
MAVWEKVLTQLAAAARPGIRQARRQVTRTLGLPPGDHHIVTYRGWGGAAGLFVQGRVLRGRPVAEADAADPWWRNAWSAYRRLGSDEVPGARVRLSGGGTEQQAVSDREGYFRAWLRPAAPLPADRRWHQVTVELVEPRPAEGPPPRTVAHVLTPAAAATFGVISDIDDTVVRTDATSFLRMARLVVFGNARTRIPFHGVSAFYRALHTGPRGGGPNPLFYVSSGPWNFYELLVEFMEHRAIPLGPILLRDWGWTGERSMPTRHRVHKLEAIRHILDSYPTLPFILIGDSGQEDPEIYHEIVGAYSNRIMAVYIRDVGGIGPRREEIAALREEVRRAGSDLVLARDTVAAARHAAEAGWINPEALPGIEADTASDEFADREETEQEAGG